MFSQWEIYFIIRHGLSHIRIGWWSKFHKMKEYPFSQRKLLQLEGANTNRVEPPMSSYYILTFMPPSFKKQNWDIPMHKHTENCQLSSHKQCRAVKYAKSLVLTVSWVRFALSEPMTCRSLCAYEPPTRSCSFVIQSARSNLTYLSSNPGRFPTCHRTPPPPSSVNQGR